MAGLNGMTPMDANRIMTGTFCQIFYDGRWISNAQSAEISLEVEKTEIRRAGTRSVGTKIVGYKGSGSISGYKVTTELLQNISQIIDDNKKPFITELIFKVQDPESDGQVMRVRVKDVSFDKVDILKYSVGEIISEELPFTFTTFEWMDTIK
jgi:hypothetical protein